MTHVVCPFHLLEVGPVLLRHLLPPLVELVRVHLEGLVAIRPFDFNRRRSPIHIKHLVQLISKSNKNHNNKYTKPETHTVRSHWGRQEPVKGRRRKWVIGLTYSVCSSVAHESARLI